MVVATTPVDEGSVDPGSPTRSRWWWPRLPATSGYLSVLVIVTAVFTAVGESTRSRVVLDASTNLNNLLDGRLGTLFASALVIGDVGVAWMIIPLLGCLLALAELRFGAMRLMHVFLAGHIGATLLVAAGLWVAVTAGWLPASISWAEDVGISYGAMALVGALIAAMPPRWRIGWAGAWFVVGAGGIVLGQTFTNVGHLLSLCIGLTAGYGMIRAKAASPRRLTRVEWALLATSIVLAGAVLLG
ncbi:DUF1515 domain-containing protein [Nocardia australiensis]|uniref:DUF1515 domain-containing protein n=1 Tax=Nocardia australiensis TaxID=2887191 RepID=UPI001D155A7F|nr:DUF1515 domain-containing protein [Nocardia australiensis]